MKNKPENIDHIIEMAWCDKTSFEDIELQTGLCESTVIDLMRSHLKPSSFKLWRKRVTGRRAKHRARQKSFDSSEQDEKTDDPSGE